MALLNKKRRASSPASLLKYKVVFYPWRRTTPLRRLFVQNIILVFCLALAARGDSLESTNSLVESPARLKKLSLEELMNLEVTSVSKKQERLTTAPAAVHVVTGEDIRRSGARSIPEALRLAPNLQVAQTGARNWAISSRGFNGSVGNKLLVLMDGRTLYTPLFSGVFWDAQDYLLADLDRIEVISGPGGTLWGANAVNGVINIMTKSAKDTQGFLITAGGGTEHRDLGGLRYGGKLGENVYYRVYGKFFDRDDSVLASGANADDAWRMGQGGLRVDWDIAEGNLITLQGDGYGGAAEQRIGDDLGLAGGNILGRWTRRFEEDSELQVQAYYDRTHRDVPGQFRDDLDTYDVEAQYRFILGERHALLAGIGYRFTSSETRGSPLLMILPPELERHLFNAFVQDEITLVEDRLKLTIGSKFEQNDYTGFEFQPSIRLAWTGERQMAWGAISRAVRTPSRIDRHFFLPGVLAGGSGFDSEELIAYELGYRIQPQEKIFATIAAFYNVYDDIRSLRPGPPAVIGNGLEGDIYGAELEFTFQATDWWQLKAGYTWMQDDIRTKPGLPDVNAGVAEASDPEQQFLVRSSIDLPRDFEFDSMLRFVDTLPAGGGSVPSYVQLDVRLGWMPAKNWEISLVGQNLLDNQHPEFGTPSALRREIERGFYGKVTWRF